MSRFNALILKNTRKPSRPKLNDSGRSVDTLDFLTLPFETDGELIRLGEEFRVLEPWATARLDPVELEQGWWVFECNGPSAAVEDVELRLSAPSMPLLVVSGSQAAGKTDELRLYLPRSDTFHITLLLSAWPSCVSFSVLRFRKMSAREIAAMIATGIGRFLHTKDRLGKARHIFRHWAAGRSLMIAPSPVYATDETKPAPSAGDVKAMGSFVVEAEAFHAILNPQDELHPAALAIVEQEFRRRPVIQAFYCDVFDGFAVTPQPEWDNLLANGWKGFPDSPLFVRGRQSSTAVSSQARARSLVQSLGTGAIGRIALPLAFRSHTRRERFELPPPVLSRLPFVSIVIPTKFRIDLLEKCFDGLMRRTGYPNLEVVLVDNGSADPRLPGLIKRVSAELQLAHLVDAGPFNFSRLINNGARRSSGEILVLMNDDIEPTEGGWLHRMVDSAMAEDAGAVGARLLYPNRSIQHAGVVLGIGGVAGHMWKGMPEDVAACSPFVALPSERSAVTGACLAVRRALFDAVGGLDEAFAVTLNDIDFCLRLRAEKYRNVYRGDAVLIHHESQSRGNDTIQQGARRRLEEEIDIFFQRWRKQIDHDPFGSPAFDQRVENGAVSRAALRPWLEIAEGTPFIFSRRERM